MLADVSSQFVVLFVLEGLQIMGTVLMTSRFASITRTIPVILQQVFYDGRIIKEPVDVGADAVVSLQDGLVGIADTLMNLVTLTRLTIKIERHLTRGLLGRHRSVDGQES